MIEYKLMYNCYDGQGDHEYSIRHFLEEILRDKAYVDEFIVNEKGQSWILEREVTEWRVIN